MQKGNEIIFTADDGSSETFYVLEQTKLNGKNYLLVTDSDVEEEELSAFIMKEIENDSLEENTYEMVEDENEIEIISKIFEELLDDIDLELE